jgi:hypothetical protein
MFVSAVSGGLPMHPRCRRVTACCRRQRDGLSECCGARRFPFERLRRELDQNQILEFSMLVGHYVMAGMMLGVAGVQIEPAFELNAT